MLVPEADDSSPQVRGLVLTYRRRRQATETVRHLVEAEGFDPGNILLVVNAHGGLDDADLAQRVPTVVLRENLGPAGGFREGLMRLAEDERTDWIYVCEDDVGALSLPAPRVRELVTATEAVARDQGRRIGAVVSYGRRLDRRTGLTRPQAAAGEGDRFQPTDVAAWGSTLVAAGPVREGVLPDADFFFGYEDFDFFLQLQGRGYEVLLDRDAAVAVADETLHGYVSASAVETWRTYYATRNFLELRRRHGHLGWTVVHLLKSLRRCHLIHSRAGCRAILEGLRDGFRHKLGRKDFGRAEAD